MGSFLFLFRMGQFVSELVNSMSVYSNQITQLPINQQLNNSITNTPATQLETDF